MPSPHAQAAGLVANTGAGWRLTAAGREIAVLVMRAHRLVETRLARESGVAAGRWHDIAHAIEHRLTRDFIDRLADQLGNPRFDPHGDPIPTREGWLPKREGRALLGWSAGEPAVISHIEDEPAALFARLAAAGVFAGMRLALHSVSPAGCELMIKARRAILPLELAALVRVRPLAPGESPPPADACRFDDLAVGTAGRVLGLLAGCAGQERSRLLDLGFVPGTRVEPDLRGPFNGPVAHRVRGTLIALRREQAGQVLVRPCAADEDSTPGSGTEKRS